MKAERESFIRLSHDLMRTAAWQTLSAGAIRVLLYLWSLHNGRNNGEIACTLSDLQRQFHCGRSAALGWLHELEDRRFIVATRRGSFQTKSGSYVSRTDLAPDHGKIRAPGSNARVSILDAARPTGATAMKKNAAHVVEAYFERWLTKSAAGKLQVADLGFDGAMDALWQLLNGGFIKLQRNGLAITNIIPQNPPRPPAEPLARPGKPTHEN